MSVSKNDYKAIANEINQSRKGIICSGETQEIWDAAIAYATIGIANVLDELCGLDVNGNRRFNRLMFYVASGLTHDDFVRSGRNPKIAL